MVAQGKWLQSKEKKGSNEYLRSFTWERTARETLEVYKKC